MRIAFIISSTHACSGGKSVSVVGISSIFTLRKLLQAIQRKKRDLGIKSDGIEMQYEY